MHAFEARRRRGFFLHSSDTEPDTGEHETPEGVGLRVRISRRIARRQLAGNGRSRTQTQIQDDQLQFRSGNVTGSRQRSHLPR